MENIPFLLQYESTNSLSPLSSNPFWLSSEFSLEDLVASLLRT